MDNLRLPKTGSSPRVRGTGIFAIFFMIDPRFIPACAGNSPFPWVDISRASVHPRVCGEQIIFGYLPNMLSGSSPRVRGTAFQSCPNNHKRRFIPACAGNRVIPLIAEMEETVHPRVCGEQGVKSTAVTGANRFIPACAGNRKAEPRPPPPRTVHPRVCGEQRFFHGRFK